MRLIEHTIVSLGIREKLPKKILYYVNITYYMSSRNNCNRTCYSVTDTF